MKQKKNGFFITILLLLISLAFIVTVSVVFNNIKTNLEREIISSLSEEAEENAALIEKEIDAKFGVLQSFANELSSTGDEIAEIRDMQSFVEVYNFRRMGFVDLNGIAKTTDGFEKDLSFREFYQVGLKGESFITESLQETIGDSTEDMINILSVPVYDNKGEIKGVLFATYLTEKFHEVIFSDSFQGEGYTYIVAGDGDVISSYGDGMQKEYDNIFIYTGDAAQYDDAIQEKVENDMREKISRVGIGVNEDSDKYFYCYKPLEIESADMNWYIFSIEPKSVLDERMHPIMRDIQFLTVILICILVMANIIFLFYNVRRRQELFRLAYKDSITGGDNFSNFKEKAKKYENTEGYVIALDISEFKLVNNVCGNASGDEVLKVIWDVIMANCNDNEQAARVNADRFVIFWIERSKKTVTYRIEKLINEIEGISEQLSVPRLYPVIGIRAVEKLDDADKRYGEALRAKALVKNRRDRHYAFYDEIDYDTIVENKKLENGFEKALADKKFEVWYQPKFNSHTGKIVGSEALIRWRAETDAMGFCRHHYKMMYDYGNRLGSGLILSTHLKKLNQELAAQMDLFAPGKSSVFKRMQKTSLDKQGRETAIGQWIDEKTHSCYVCDHFKANYNRYLDTFFDLYKKDEEFARLFREGKGFCLPHFADLVETAEKKLNDKQKAEFYPTLFKIMKENYQRLQEEVTWFTDKFDYRNKDKDWGNSKDSIQRCMQKLGGGYPADEPFTEGL